MCGVIRNWWAITKHAIRSENSLARQTWYGFGVRDHNTFVNAMHVAVTAYNCTRLHSQINFQGNVWAESIINTFSPLLDFNSPVL